MRELQTVSVAFNRVELIYDQKNPLFKRLLNSAKKDKNNLYTADIPEILNLTRNLNDSVEKGISELEQLGVIIPDSKLIPTSIAYLKSVNSWEKDVPEFLKLVTDTIDNNHIEQGEKISKGISEMYSSKSNYQNQINIFYRENKFSKREIDSLIGKE
ncbi:hypothetical protein [Salinimicrobium sp. TH3]|uniref:hypothetical protein n=1 Tax=Salinimicrobium sp. TH3 TaxID=2997342 RepID=UPI00227642CA|nr:hypothetical protein [Salinimicrobium sp. TH3]MCY2686783.1 hypothetical protein [Salinimicrobium sp. TH3]